jgi:hypothetical protein
VIRIPAATSCAPRSGTASRAIYYLRSRVSCWGPRLNAGACAECLALATSALGGWPTSSSRPWRRGERGMAVLASVIGFRSAVPERVHSPDRWIFIVRPRPLSSCGHRSVRAQIGVVVAGAAGRCRDCRTPISRSTRRSNCSRGSWRVGASS